MKEKTKIWFIAFLIVMLMVLLFTIVCFLRYSHSSYPKIKSYCEEKGYDYYKQVDNYFNCCKEEIKIIDNIYTKSQVCIAGGVIPKFPKEVGE